jgi:phosphoribosylformylglycinamidine cyclo-ligase
VLPVIEKLNRKMTWGVKGLVHVTGGGFTDNIPRILPSQLDAQIIKGSWRIPPIFQEIQERAKLSEKQMYWTFNMGIGLIMAVSLKVAMDALDQLPPDAVILGKVVKGSGTVRYV